MVSPEKINWMPTTSETSVRDAVTLCDEATDPVS
jgi:hypothetical protein